MTAKKIPSASPLSAFAGRRDEIMSAITRVMESGSYILGPSVAGFEEAFASYLGAGFCTGVASGTDALHLSLRALGVGTGDQVIAPAHTSVATVAAIEMAGAEPVLADIDGETFTISPESVAGILSGDSAGRVKCIIPVHLYGHPADMKEILRLARPRKIRVVEDCAQAHGARWRGHMCGTLGDLGAFSFYPTKNLGGFGDGGAVCGMSGVHGVKTRLLRQYGWETRYESAVPGFNSRLDEIQAAILEIRLKGLEQGNQARREIAGIYGRGLAGLPVRLPTERKDCFHVYHQYTIRLENRDALATWLDERGIETAVLYPLPVHLQGAYRGRIRVAPGGVGGAESACKELLCLPIYPELGRESAGAVVEAVREYFSARGPGRP